MTPTVATATIYRVTYVRRDQTWIILANCDRCGHKVRHRGGDLREPIILGSRSPHCLCRGNYELIIGESVEALAPRRTHTLVPAKLVTRADLL